MKTGAQTWRDLLFLHWEVDASTIAPFLPRGVEVDTFDRRAYVGLVPFTMGRVFVGPLPLGTFLETNLRTYVVGNGVPGVWFFSLDAESLFTVVGARTVLGLPYHRAEMRCAVEGDAVEYATDRVHSATKVRLDVRWTVIDRAPHAAAAGTLEHFLTERYALYGPKRDGGAYRMRVKHSPWPLRRARVDRLATSILSAAGLPEAVEARPPIDLVLASPEGVRVETGAPEAP